MPLAEKENSYPEPYTIFGPLPAYGIVLRHVEECAIVNPVVTCDKPDLRPAVFCNDVRGISIEKPMFKNSATNPAAILSVQESPGDAVKWTGGDGEFATPCSME